MDLSLTGKKAIITGGSRGIGFEIAKSLISEGVNVVIAARDPVRLRNSAALLEKAYGVLVHHISYDIKDTVQVESMVQEAKEMLSGLDILINNASAISLTGTLQTPMKRFDLMHQINSRGTFLVSKVCLPHLLESENPHILNLSPPLDMSPKWFGPHVAYTMAKFGMSLCVLGMAEEFKEQGVAVNALWPRTAVATAAIKNALGGDEIMNISRAPEIMGDAAYVILTKDSKEFTGNFCIDDNLLADNGVTDFSQYAEVPFDQLAPDFFVPEDLEAPESAKNS